MVARNFTPGARQTLKDAHLMLDQAGKVGQQLPPLSVHADYWTPAYGTVKAIRIIACHRGGNPPADSDLAQAAQLTRSVPYRPVEIPANREIYREFPYQASLSSDFFKKNNVLKVWSVS